jgi:hypothetical protein
MNEPSPRNEYVLPPGVTKTMYPDTRRGMALMSNDNFNGSPREILFLLMRKESAEWPLSLGMTARAEHSTIPMVRREDAIFTYGLDVMEPHHKIHIEELSNTPIPS